MNNTIGKGGFDWWIGEVEDTNDPLKMGRCKVRVFGRHTDNQTQLPTKSLPWATLTHSPNNSHAVGTPLEGDWVLGFFSDGEAGQMPIVLSVFNSIPGVITKSKTDNPIKTDPPSGQVSIRSAGQPTTARLGRGIVANTNIAATNISRHFPASVVAFHWQYSMLFSPPSE